MLKKNETTVTRIAALASLAVALALGAADRAAVAASPGTAAMEKAANGNKYLFVLFYSAADAPTNAMNGVLQAAMARMADRASAIAINAADPAEKAIIDRFQVRGAPLPMILAIAPTGAPTHAFPKTVTEAQLDEAFVTPCTAKCIRAIFDRQSVLVCVQNDKTQFSQEAMLSAVAFKADPQYTKGTAIVTLNPADPTEQTFLKSLQVDPNTPVAVTVLVTPPGAPVARLPGAVTKEQIEAAVKLAQTNCGPACSCHK